MAAKTPQGPPSCCTRPIAVSGSGLNLKNFTILAKRWKVLDTATRMVFQSLL